MPRPASPTRRLCAAPTRLLTLCVLLAFFFQSLAVQTHVHHPAQQAAAQAAGRIQVANIPAPAPLKSQDPADPANCRLCQELAHAGVYVAPAPAPLAILVSIAAAAPTLLTLSMRAAMPAFGWQSRAPPIR
jgi:hypothetical protein